MSSPVKQSSTILHSVFESLLSLRPMFDFKPIEPQFSTFSKNSTYTHAFGFERIFESNDVLINIEKWMKSNWRLSILVSIIYIVLVGLSKHWMQSRPKYELRVPLITWNAILAVFSITGAIRVLPEFFYALTHHGIVYSVCDGGYAYGLTGFWAFMFVMSKVPELIDTFFIIFRKQQLIFLHWYHHMTVLVYCFYSYKDFTSCGRWFMNMNYVVHGLMYSYYALKAMRIRVPMCVSQLITTLQIMQMIFGCYVNWVAYQTKVNSPNTTCIVTYENIYIATAMYLSYFVLFIHFFMKAYVFRSSSAPVKNETRKDKKAN